MNTTIWNELGDCYHAGYAGHRIFWEELDRISWRDTVEVATRLCGYQLVVGKDWVQLCSMLDHHRRHPEWNWTRKQIRWLKMLVVRHWQDLSVLCEQ